MRRKAASLSAPLVSPLVALATPVLAWGTWQGSFIAFAVLALVYIAGFVFTMKTWGEHQTNDELEKFRKEARSWYTRFALWAVWFIYGMSFGVFVLLTWYFILSYRQYRGGQRFRAVPTTT
jgi:nitrate/nitrite transporter NarK